MRKRRKKKTKRKRRKRRKTELEKTSDFVLGTGKLLVQTSAVMGIARAASDVINQ